MNNLKISIFAILISLSFISKANSQDIDNDGVPDTADNCIFIWNPTQQDNDADLIGDSCDCNSSDSNPNGQHIPAIIITATPSTTINAGTLVNFASTIDAGGTSPIFQWKKNGINVGISNPNYSDNTLNNGDIISCELTSDVICLAGNVKTSNSLTFVVTVLSINDVTFNNSDVLIYPNPSKKEFTIKSNSNPDSIEILSLIGKSIKILELKNNSIDIEGIPKGVYILKMTLNKKFIYKKIIIE